MGLRKHAIDWRDDAATPAPQADAPAPSPAPSPALMLQALLEQHSAVLARPQIGRDALRRLAMMLAAGGCALWIALVASADMAVSLVA